MASSTPKGKIQRKIVCSPKSWPIMILHNKGCMCLDVTQWKGRRIFFIISLCLDVPLSIHTMLGRSSVSSSYLVLSYTYSPFFSCLKKEESSKLNWETIRIDIQTSTTIFNNITKNGRKIIHRTPSLKSLKQQLPTKETDEITPTRKENAIDFSLKVPQKENWRKEHSPICQSISLPI